ncbi:MAG TPA: hypothetical protein VIA06_07975 [Candidatus Dormibacteraeota bacterium]|jgi:hypothetical protein|nr:hypothetical protein [Candidatus Dormibacteraeota bacterium]
MILHLMVFMAACTDLNCVQGDLTTSLLTPLVNILQLCVPAAVGLYILYKVVSGHTEHAKMLIAEGVVAAGVLEGLFALVKAMNG